MKLMYYSCFLCFLWAFTGYAQITQSATVIKSSQPNTSGLGFTNLTNASSASASNGKALSVDATGNVILTLAPGGAASYWQLTGNDIANTNTGAVKVSNLQVGNTASAVAGTIRWTGSDFEGYNGSAWKSLTAVSSTPVSFWAIASSTSSNGCTGVCPSGYTPAADQSGKTCKNANGFTGSSVTRCTFVRREGQTTYSEQRWGCDSPASTEAYGYQLTQCHCIKVTP